MKFAHLPVWSVAVHNKHVNFTWTQECAQYFMAENIQLVGQSLCLMHVGPFLFSIDEFLMKYK